MSKIANCASAYPQYSLPYVNRCCSTATGTVNGGKCCGGYGPVQTECGNVMAEGRLSSAARLLCELRQYSPDELELAWWFSQLSGHHTRYAHDNSGLSYLSGAVLASGIAQQLRLESPADFRNHAPAAVSPPAAVLDVRV